MGIGTIILISTAGVLFAFAVLMALVRWSGACVEARTAGWAAGIAAIAFAFIAAVSTTGAPVVITKYDYNQDIKDLKLMCYWQKIQCNANDLVDQIIKLREPASPTTPILGTR